MSAAFTHPFTPECSTQAISSFHSPRVGGDSPQALRDQLFQDVEHRAKSINMLFDSFSKSRPFPWILSPTDLQKFYVFFSPKTLSKELRFVR